MTPTETRLEVAPGFSLAALRWGPSSGRPIILVHGFLDHALAWASVATRLVDALERPVLAFDQRGHGLSDHVGPEAAYHIWDQVADADSVARLVGRGRPVDVVGHSMGGSVSALLAATHPEIVHRLVLVEGLGPPDLRGMAVQRARDFLDFRHAPRKHPVFPSPQAAAARMTAVDPRLTRELAGTLANRVVRPVAPGDPHVRDTAAHGWTWTWDPRHRCRHPYPFSPDIHGRFLAAITSPTLVVTAAQGFKAPDHVERLARLAAGREVEVPDVGHMVHRDAPEALAALVVEHLAS